MNKNRLSFTDKIFNSSKNNKKIELFRDVRFSPVTFETLLKVIRLIIKNIYGIYNLGSKYGMTKEDFGINFCKSLDMNFNHINPNYLKNMTNLVSRPFDMRLDSSKLEKKLNLKFTSTKNEIKRVKSNYL